MCECHVQIDADTRAASWRISRARRLGGGKASAEKKCWFSVTLLGL